MERRHSWGIRSWRMLLHSPRPNILRRQADRVIDCCYQLSLSNSTQNSSMSDMAMLRQSSLWQDAYGAEL